MFFKTPFFVWAISSILVCSCAQRLKVPITRTMSPEAISHGAEIEYKHTAFKQGVMQFKDGRTDNPLLLSRVSERELYMGLGLTKGIDGFVKVPFQTVTLLGLKVQLYGSDARERANGHKLAITAAMGAQSDTFEGATKVTIRARAQEYALIHGYRLGRYLLVYESVSLSNYNFSGNVQSSEVDLNDNTYKYRANNTLGLHFGAEVGVEYLMLRAEYSFQRISWDHTEAELGHAFGLSILASF